MEAYIYPASLLLVAIMAFQFYKNHDNLFLLIAIGVAVYIVYTHETGDSITNWKNSAVESIDRSAEDFSKNNSNKSFD